MPSHLTSLSCLLSLPAQLGRPQEALAVWAEMRAAAVEPNLPAFNALLGVHARLRQWEHCFKVGAS